MLVQNILASPDGQLIERPPSGGHGLYRVVFTFSRPGIALTPESRICFEGGLRGDSHLAIAEPAIVPVPGAEGIAVNATVNGEEIPFRGVPNEKGMLAKMVLEQVRANSFKEAADFGFEAIAPWLSQVSTALDLPLHIYQIDVVELETLSASISCTSSFQEIALAVPPNTSLPLETRFFLSLYREALDSNSANYQFLCFFKILEGLGKRAKLMGKGGADIGTSMIPKAREEWVPWLDSIYPFKRDWDELSLEAIFTEEVRGRKVNYIVNELLRPVRKEIAHAFLDSGALGISPDITRRHRDVTKWLPIARCLARARIKAHFPGLGF